MPRRLEPLFHSPTRMAGCRPPLCRNFNVLKRMKGVIADVVMRWECVVPVTVPGRSQQVNKVEPRMIGRTRHGLRCSTLSGGAVVSEADSFGQVDTAVTRA